MSSMPSMPIITPTGRGLSPFVAPNIPTSVLHATGFQDSSSPCSSSSEGGFVDILALVQSKEPVFNSPLAKYVFCYSVLYTYSILSCALFQKIRKG